MGWFESQSTKEKKSAVKSVVAVMLADGEITDSELDVLRMVCVRVGLSPNELKTILDNPKSVKFTPASSLEERVRQLMDATFMMMADGEIHENEVDLCMKLAVVQGFQPSIVKDMVEKIIDGVRQSKESSQVQSEVEAILEE